MLDFDEKVDEMGEKGCRVRGDCISRTLAPTAPALLPNECFFTGTLAMSNPLRTAYGEDKIQML